MSNNVTNKVITCFGDYGFEKNNLYYLIGYIGKKSSVKWQSSTNKFYYKNKGTQIITHKSKNKILLIHSKMSYFLLNWKLCSVCDKIRFAKWLIKAVKCYKP